MIKRISLCSLGTLVFLLATLLLWQPERLQRKVVDYVLARVEQTTPYIVQVNRLSGNFFTRITLHDVRVRPKGASQDLVKIKKLDLGLQWKALWHKRIEIGHLIFTEPLIQLRIAKNNKLDLPPWPDIEETQSSALPVTVKRLEIHNAQVVLANEATQPTQQLVFQPIDLNASVSPTTLTIDRLLIGLLQGQLQLKGDVGLQPSVSANVQMDVSRFPLQQLLKLQMVPLKPLRMVYSGHWHIEGEHPHWSATTQGRLEGAPLTASAQIDMRGPMQADVELKELSVNRFWMDPSMKDLGRLSAAMHVSNDHSRFKRINAQGNLRLGRASTEQHSEEIFSAHVDLSEGQGPISWVIGAEGLAASGTAHVNIPNETMSGQFQVALSSFAGLAEFFPVLEDAQGSLTAHGTWNGPWTAPAFDISTHGQALARHHLGMALLDATATGDLARSREIHVEAQAKDILWDTQRESPWDIASANVTLQGAPSLWHPSLTAKFRNESQLHYAGSFESIGNVWNLTWDTLVLKPKKGPPLESAPHGEVHHSDDGTFEMKDLVFASDAGRIYVDRARLRWPQVDVVIRTNAWDPAGLSSLFPDFILEPGGSLRVSARIAGDYPNVSVDGEGVAQFPRVKIPPAGLDLHNFLAEIRSQGHTLTVRQFTANTKGGDIHMSGSSVLPALNFVLEGNNVDINIAKWLQATSNFRFLIGGDLEGPDLSGDLHISKATYTVPKKSKKEKEAEELQAASQTASAPAYFIWEGTTLDVNANWLRNVWYRDGLSKIETSGDLRIQKEEGTTTPYLTGRISILRGTYSAYGRDFTLSSGDIAFTGPPDINPILNIEATYKSGGTIVFLDVTGTAQSPQLALRSNPPLPQQDIISVLVLGQPLNRVQNNPAGPTISQSAQAEALAGSVIGSMVTNQLRESGLDLLGLDVVRVEPTTQGNVLMVGRYVGPNLFVSYGQPLQSSASRAYKGEYYLSTNWTLVGQSGTPETAQANPTMIDQHLGFQFRYPLNTPHYPHKQTRSVIKTSPTVVEPSN